ncbi:MAG: ThiF family adenylyltransferase [Planctomycetota bacterium]
MSVDRYARQSQFQGIGADGQQAISQTSVLVCGCGALGSMIANLLARAGVGKLRVVDRDFVELNNLQRQTLYDEHDVTSALPKAVAAANRLRKINSSIEIEPIVADITAHNMADLIQDIDLIADGTDNFETRFLLNDAAHRWQLPWVFGGCIGAEGQVMVIRPGHTPCFRCLVPQPPPLDATPTCDTTGVTGPIVGVIASLQAMELLKLAAGRAAHCNRQLMVVDLWDNRLREVDLSRLADNPGCPTCGQGDFEWLEGRRGSQAEVLCGRNAVQVSAEPGTAVSFDELQAKVKSVGRVVRNEFLLRLFVDDYVVTVFTDGRAIVAGTDDPAQARIVYARYVGH